MNPVWTSAILISAVMFGGAWYFATRAGMGYIGKLLFASAFFPAPLFVVIGGSNSFAYLYDFITPLAIAVAARRWACVPPSARSIALLIGGSIGLAPFLASLLLGGSRTDVMLSGVNLYRLTGAMAALCVFSAARTPRALDSGQLLNAVAWVNITLFVAMVLQGAGFFNSNYLYASESIDVWGSVADKYVVAGMFRASLGIIGMLGVAALITCMKISFTRTPLIITGGICGVLVIILSGSKTSIFAALGLTAALLLLFPSRRRLMILAVIIGIAVFGAAERFMEFFGDSAVEKTLNVVLMHEDSLNTYRDRESRREEALALVEAYPSILIGYGMHVQNISGINMSYWHSEYIMLLIAGGVWTFIGYLAGLYFLAKNLFRNHRRASLTRIFAVGALVGGLTQGLTAAHIFPGILFISTATAFLCIYGMALNPWWKDEPNYG